MVNVEKLLEYLLVVILVVGSTLLAVFAIEFARDGNIYGYCTAVGMGMMSIFGYLDAYLCWKLLEVCR